MNQKGLVTELGNFKEIRRFIVGELKETRIDKRGISETLLVFEALYNDILEQGVEKSREVDVRVPMHFGDVRVIIGFEGEMYAPAETKEGGYSTDDMIMGAYAEKIVNSYHAGYNSISIRVRRKYSVTIVLSLFGILLAVLAYLAARSLLAPQAQSFLLEEIVFPTERLYTNAVLMIGAPVTFFSLLRNLTDAHIVAERSSEMRRLQSKTFSSSVVAAILALGTGVIITHIFGIPLHVSSFAESNISIGGLIESLIPPSIFSPFETLMPFSIIFLSMAMVYGMCQIGRDFDGVKKVIDTCYALFAKILAAIVYVIPVFCFLAFLDVLLSDGLEWLGYIMLLGGLVVLGSSAMFVYYAIKLKVNGVRIGEFARKLPPILHETWVLSSSIDAVPFNIRYCTVHYGLDRKKLSETLPVLAQVNLDGNCFVITILSVLMIAGTDIQASGLDIIVILMLVVFLSLGAPNQPGSIMIGVLIVINYLQAYGAVSLAIYSEVLLGTLLTFINVTGDIVMVVSDDARSNKNKNGS